MQVFIELTQPSFWYNSVIFHLLWGDDPDESVIVS